MRKRSKYKPKGVRLDNMTWVQAGLKKVDEIGAGTTLKIRNYDALNHLREGVATRRAIVRAAADIGKQMEKNNGN